MSSAPTHATPWIRISEAAAHAGETVEVRGWVAHKRSSGKVQFFEDTWIADRDTTVGLIPLGYADGVFRGLSGRIDVSINGARYRNVGRICMDQFVVDLGPGGAGVKVGDEAVLFGSGASGEPTAQDWAELLGTINYEVVTSPRGRIARTYRGSTG